MKYKTLIGKSEKLTDKHSQGQSIKPGKLGKLQQLLIDKASGYQSKLEALDDPEKRQKLESRLNVVRAQIEKLARLDEND